MVFGSIAGSVSVSWLGIALVAGGATHRGRTLRAASSLSMALLLAVVALLMTTRAVWAAPSSVPDDTVQTDGRVSAVLSVGDRIYLGGAFTHVDGVARDRLAAIDATTGELTDWAPEANGQVMALAGSPDGTRIYAGGDFTAVGGVARSRLVAIDTATGAVDSRWMAGANSTVRALAVSGDRLYVGGDFTKLKGQRRARLALVTGITGNLNRRWAPKADDTVRTLAWTARGRRVYAGGDFARISGQSKRNLAALDAITGAPNKAWRPKSGDRPVFDLQVSGTGVYVAQGGSPGGAFAAYHANNKGKAIWRQRTDGDVLAIAVLDGKVYVGGHFVTVADQTRRFFAAADATTGALDQQWDPSGGGGYVWALTPDASRTRIYAGGDFMRVSGQEHRGFAQFSDLTIAP